MPLAAVMISGTTPKWVVVKLKVMIIRVIRVNFRMSVF
jgi:hypothetical protein